MADDRKVSADAAQMIDRSPGDPRKGGVSTMDAIFEFWFGGEEAVDKRIAERFSCDLERAMRGDYDHWPVTPHGSVALIVLFDQFPRNIHRGSSRAYAGDAKALGLCMRAMAQRQDRELSIVERASLF